MSGKRINRYVRRSIVVLISFLLAEAVVLDAALVMAIQSGDGPPYDLEGQSFALAIGMAAFVIFLAIEVYLGSRAIKSMDPAQEIGKTFAWIMTVLSAILLAWSLFWLVFAGASAASFG